VPSLSCRRATHDVGSGTHTWTEPAHPSQHESGSLSLDSDLATIIDDPEAYAAVLGAIHSLDPARAEAFRRSTRWTEGRSLREPLDKAPLPVLEAVGKALAELR
jgi:alpha-L-rhamnosidase